MSHTLAIGDSLKRNTNGDTPWNVTAKMRGWRDSVRDDGGFWTGSGTLWEGDDDRLVSREEAIQFFYTKLNNHIARKDEAGGVMWEGRISAMSLTLDGVTLTRSIDNLINSAKIVYTQHTGNILHDGSAEIGYEYSSGVPPYIGITENADGSGTLYGRAGRGESYGIVGYPGYPYPTLSISTAWKGHGARSFYLDCDPCWSEGDARYFDGDVRLYTGVSAEAGATYHVQGMLNAIEVAGPNPDKQLLVRVKCNLATPLWGYNTPLNEVGVFTFNDVFEAPTGAAGEIYIMAIGYQSSKFYFDGNVIAEAGTRTETGWLTDDDSIAEYGVLQKQIVLGGMTTAEAEARLTKIITKMACPFNQAEFTPGAKNGLTVSAEGYAFTLTQGTASVGGAKAASAHFTDLLALSPHVMAGNIETNTILVYVNDGDSYRNFDALRKVCDVGDATGAQYVWGCYGGRKVDYRKRDTTPALTYRAGKFYYLDGSPLKDAAVRPCLVKIEALPEPEESVRWNTLEHNPRYVYVSEWEYDADTDLATPVSTEPVLNL